MTNEELITKQQTEIEELKERNQSMNEALREISGKLTNIGGPLNDNRLEFNREQRALLWEIHGIASLFSEGCGC